MPAGGVWRRRSCHPERSEGAERGFSPLATLGVTLPSHQCMRVLVRPGSAIIGHRATLDESEVHHLKVRRARDDENVEVLDGAGLSGTGVLVRAGAKWLVEIRSAERRPSQPELTLAVAAGDRERFTWMAEKAVELSVTRLVPLETARTAGVASRIRQSHIQKLRRVVLDATKQCGAVWAPAVEEPVSIIEFLAGTLIGNGWLADPAGAAPAADLDDTPLTILVGPEGGFSAEEREAILGSVYRPIALGLNTLRFETAALAAAAIASSARLRGRHV
jgi:16S rRNA (uracil1498-N3)-methyltransferase